MVDLDVLVASAQARLQAASTDTGFRIMVACRTVCKIKIDGEIELDAVLKNTILELPPVLDALAGRTADKWLTSKTYINIIPGEFPKP